VPSSAVNASLRAGYWDLVQRFLEVVPSVAVFVCDAHAIWYAVGGENKNHLTRGGLYNQVWGNTCKRY
jgi:hypothetical protein